MPQILSIDPVTRIEGHGRIRIMLSEDGSVRDAQFQVTQFRGFERFVVGRPFYELPAIMGRVCGICTVSHALASAQACEAIMSVRVMGAARKLREVVNYASLIQSHALSFFYLAAPDLLLGMESDPGRRNIVGLLASHPQFARDGIALRSFGQRVIERLAGRRVHPQWIVAGGVTAPLRDATRLEILSELPAMYALVHRTLDAFKRSLAAFADEVAAFANFPTLFLSLVHEHEPVLELYRGRLQFVDADGVVVQDFHRTDYASYIGEASEPYSYLKSPYYRPAGYPAGLYRVGPIARLAVAPTLGTPRADAELDEYLDHEQHSSFFNHYARLIECLHALERIEVLLNEPDILEPRVRAYAEANGSEGVGAVEAPRGTLIHHYCVDEYGKVTSCNLIVSTTHNNLAMNRGVLQAARRYVRGSTLTEGALNRVEAVVRTFDPCLSCSTHASSQLVMRYELVASDGSLLHEVLRH